MSANTVNNPQTNLTTQRPQQDAYFNNHPNNPIVNPNFNNNVGNIPIPTNNSNNSGKASLINPLKKKSV